MSDPVRDVVILGGGLVGTTMAVALARHGLTVALVDPIPAEIRADPEFDGRAYAVAPGSANLLRALGIWDRLETEAEPVREITVTDRLSDPVPPAVLYFDPAETGKAALGWILEDRWLRGALLAAVQETTGLTHIAPDCATDVDVGSAVAKISIEAAAPLRARLVVACDGRQSATAKAAGIKYLSWPYGQTGLVAAIEHAEPHHGMAHQSFFAGGPFAVLPLPGNRSSLVWSEIYTGTF